MSGKSEMGLLLYYVKKRGTKRLIDTNTGVPNYGYDWSLPYVRMVTIVNHKHLITFIPLKMESNMSYGLKMQEVWMLRYV